MMIQADFDRLVRTASCERSFHHARTDQKGKNLAGLRLNFSYNRTTSLSSPDSSRPTVRLSRLQFENCRTGLSGFVSWTELRFDCRSLRFTQHLYIHVVKITPVVLLVFTSQRPCTFRTRGPRAEKKTLVAVPRGSSDSNYPNYRSIKLPILYLWLSVPNSHAPRTRSFLQDEAISIDALSAGPPTMHQVLCKLYNPEGRNCRC